MYAEIEPGSWTLAIGKPVFNTPTLFVIGGLVTFVMGGLTGVMVAMVPFDWQVHDTHFIVAHLHYVLIGGAVFPLLAGLYYYFPLVNGKHLSPALGRVLRLLSAHGVFQVQGFFARTDQADQAFVGRHADLADGALVEAVGGHQHEALGLGVEQVDRADLAAHGLLDPLHDDR